MDTRKWEKERERNSVIFKSISTILNRAIIPAREKKP